MNAALTAPGTCSKQTARDLTREIKRSVEQSWRLLKEAFERRAWAALGYDSWESYCTKELGTGLVRLSKELRSEAVAELTSGERPMSNRAIAAALGVSEGTVRTDLRAGAQNCAPEAEADADKEHGNEQAPLDVEVVDESFGVEVVDESFDVEVVDDQPEQEPPKEQRRVTGADGKSYPAPARDVPPPAPRKRGGRRRHQQVLDAITTRLSVFADVVGEITDLDGSMTRDEAAKFARDLDQQIRALRRMKNLLEKYAEEAADRTDAAERGADG